MDPPSPLVPESHQNFMNRDILNAEHTPGKPDSVKTVSVAARYELRVPRQLPGNPLHVRPVRNLIRGKFHLRRHDAKLIQKSIATIEMTRNNNAAAGLGNSAKAFKAQFTGHGEKEGKLSRKFVTLIADNLVAEALRIIGNMRVRSEQPARERPQRCRLLKIAEQVDFLGSRRLHPRDKQDPPSLKDALERSCVAGGIMISERSYLHTASGQPSGDLARDHGDIGAWRQTGMQVQVSGDLQPYYLSPNA